MSDDNPEAAHDGGAGPAGRPVAPGPPAPAGDQGPAETEDEDSEEVGVRSIPIGSPVDQETLAELKRRAERPDGDPPPAQEDDG